MFLYKSIEVHFLPLLLFMESSMKKEYHENGRLAYEEDEYTGYAYDDEGNFLEENCLHNADTYLDENYFKRCKMCGDIVHD